MQRISSQMNNNNTQYNLRLQESRQAKINRQIGTESRISSLRDDPLAAGHLVRYQSYLSRVNQFQKNASTLTDQYKVREGYVSQNLQIMQRVRELAVQGANGINTREDLSNMAVEVNELLKELIQNANAIGPDGDSLFSGSRTSALAFDTSVGNVTGSTQPLIVEVRYNGNVSVNKIEVDENKFLELDNSGNRVFWAEPQVIIGQRDLTSWQAGADSSISVDGVNIDINAGDNVYALASKINNSGAAVKATINPVTQGLDLRTTDSHQLWLEDTKGTVLNEIGYIKDSTQRPPYNIGEGVMSSGGSIFDTVISLRDAMLRGDTESIGGRVLGVLDSGMNNLTTNLARIGSEYERAQNNMERNSAQALNVVNMVSREGDVDITDAITDLKMLDYVNQATLSTAGKMYSSTLLDYIR